MPISNDDVLENINWKGNNTLGGYPGIFVTSLDNACCTLVQLCIPLPGKHAASFQRTQKSGHQREENKTREPVVVTRDSVTFCCQALLTKVSSKALGLSSLCHSHQRQELLQEQKPALTSILNPDFLTVSHHKTIAHLAHV